MISRWRRPKNPQRNPIPSAGEFSGSYWKDASLRRSFSRAFLRSTMLLSPAGNIPEKTMGFASLNPGSGRDVRFFFSVIRPNDQRYLQIESQVMISPQHQKLLSVEKMRTFQMDAMKFSFQEGLTMGFIQPRPGTTYDWPDETQGKTSSSSTLCATAMDMAIFGQTFSVLSIHGVFPFT